MHKLYELKEMLCEELEEYGSKDKLDVGGLEIVDKLAHAIKNIDKIIEAEEYSERGSYESYGRGRSNDSYGYDSYGRDSYRDSYGRSYEGYASRRGRGRNARRDSMGRYARANEMMVDELRELMEKAPDEETRMKLERFIQSM